jgi:lysosomal acid lipase/cholesteryl ester hydrolase
MLCELGFDVWVTNNRGNIYSLGHSTMEVGQNRDYWNYSMDELVEYDVTANIKHVLKTTGRERVVYLGHSQGTT